LKLAIFVYILKKAKWSSQGEPFELDERRVFHEYVGVVID
jgi:hypothetical protein